MKKVPSFDRPWRAAATWRIEAGPTLLRLLSSAVKEIVSRGHDNAKAVFGGGGRKGRVGGSFLFIGTLVSLARSINHRLSFVCMENGEKGEELPFFRFKSGEEAGGDREENFRGERKRGRQLWLFEVLCLLRTSKRGDGRWRYSLEF